MTSCEFSHKLEEVDHNFSPAMTEDHLQPLTHASSHDSSHDSVLQVLQETICRGLPENKSEVPDSIHAYYDFQDELTVQDQLVFEWDCLVIPAAVRREMMEVAHATHIGVEGCIRRVWELMFWPCLLTELKVYTSKCDVCMAHQARVHSLSVKQSWC